MFPNIRFTLKSGSRSRLSLFYNRRIDRPGEDILRIFPKYDDPELLKIGNPSLRPQFTQNFEAAHKFIWQSGSFYSSLYHRITDAYYTRIYIQDPLHSEITIKAYDNLGKATNTGIELSFDQRAAKNWNLSSSVNIYRNSISAHTGQIRFPVLQTWSVEKRTDTPMFAKVASQFNLFRNYRAEISGIWFSAKNTGQGRELSRGGVDLGLKRSVLKNKLEINLTATDLFNTMGIRQEINGNGFRVEYQNYYETQVISIALKYKFGV